jgi:hypothetical protein
MCGCFSKIETSLKKLYGKSFALNTGGNFGYVLNDGGVRLIISLPVFTGNDHSLGFTISGHHLAPALYCPFCGARLE